MVHRGTLPSGAQEWSCPMCGRHFIVQWLPDYQRLILAEGDGNAAHVGTNADLWLEGTEMSAQPSAERAWQRWLDDHGLT
jgi:hypothetical protein